MIDATVPRLFHAPARRMAGPLAGHGDRHAATGRCRMALLAGTAAIGLMIALAAPQPAAAQSPELRTIYQEITKLYQAGAYQQAIEVTKSGISLSEAEFGETHVATAALINNLAVFHKELEQYEDAEPLYRRALDIRRDQLGANHLDVAQSLNNLAVLYLAMGRLEDAEPLYEEALAIREDNLDPYHPDVAQSLNNLAVLYAALDRNDEAEEYYNEALDLLSATGTDAALDLHKATLRNLAGLYEKQGRSVEASDAIAQAELLDAGGTRSVRRSDPEPVTDPSPDDPPSDDSPANDPLPRADSEAAEPAIAATEPAPDDTVAPAGVEEAAPGSDAVAATDPVAGAATKTEPPQQQSSARQSLARQSSVRGQIILMPQGSARDALGLDLVDQALRTINAVNEELAEMKRNGRMIDSEIGILPTADTGAAAPAAPAGAYSVQTGVYLKREIATIWQQRLRARGYAVRLVERRRTDGNPYFSLLHGNFESRAAARSAAHAFKRKENLDALVVAN